MISSLSNRLFLAAQKEGATITSHRLCDSASSGIVHVAARPVCKSTTVAVFEPAASLATWAAFHTPSTSTHGTPTRIEATTKALWTDAALLDKDALTTNFMRVCADRGLVGGWGGEVGKRAILKALSASRTSLFAKIVIPFDD